MGIFYSPFKLISLYKDKDLLVKDSTEVTEREKPEWYFSQDGKNAYNNATTPAQKTLYFFYYLRSVYQSRDTKASEKKELSTEEIVTQVIDGTYGVNKSGLDTLDVIYRIAYVMAHSMDASSMEFAGYPNILDPEKNPLVKYLGKTIPRFDTKAAYGLDLLATFHHADDAAKYSSPECNPYTFLEYYDSKDDITDTYKIERDIIGSFCADYDGNYMPPFLYSVRQEEKQ